MDGAILEQLHPVWSAQTDAKIDLKSTWGPSSLGDPARFTNCIDKSQGIGALYAVGGPSAEMYAKSLNCYLGRDAVVVSKYSQFGTFFLADGVENLLVSGHITVGPEGIYGGPDGLQYALCSPGGWSGANNFLIVGGMSDYQIATTGYGDRTKTLCCPIVAISRLITKYKLY